MVLARPVVRRERRGPHALHVPEMEVLVRREEQEVLVSALLHEGESGYEQRGGSPMLQAAPTLVVQVHDEEVAVLEGEPAEHRGERLADSREVGNHPPAVEVAAPPDHQLVRDALHAKGMGRVRSERAHLERAVHQLVVVLGVPRAVALRERHPGPPFGRRLGAHRAGLVLATDEERARGGRIEEGVRRIDVVGADRQLETTEPVLDADAARSRRGDAPGLLVDLLHRERTAALVHGAQAIDVTLVLADQVAARGPDGQPRLHRRQAAGIRLERDLGAARLWLGDLEDIRRRHARQSTRR